MLILLTLSFLNPNSTNYTSGISPQQATSNAALNALTEDTRKHFYILLNQTGTQVMRENILNDEDQLEHEYNRQHINKIARIINKRLRLSQDTTDNRENIPHNKYLDGQSPSPLLKSNQKRFSLVGLPTHMLNSSVVSENVLHAHDVHEDSPNHDNLKKKLSKYSPEIADTIFAALKILHEHKLSTPKPHLSPKPKKVETARSNYSSLLDQEMLSESADYSEVTTTSKKIPQMDKNSDNLENTLINFISQNEKKFIMPSPQHTEVQHTRESSKKLALRTTRKSFSVRLRKKINKPPSGNLPEGDEAYYNTPPQPQISTIKKKTEHRPAYNVLGPRPAGRQNNNRHHTGLRNYKTNKKPVPILRSTPPGLRHQKHHSSTTARPRETDKTPPLAEQVDQYIAIAKQLENLKKSIAKTSVRQHTVKQKKLYADVRREKLKLLVSKQHKDNKVSTNIPQAKDMSEDGSRKEFHKHKTTKKPHHMSRQISATTTSMKDERKNNTIVAHPPKIIRSLTEEIRMQFEKLSLILGPKGEPVNILNGYQMSVNKIRSPHGSSQKKEAKGTTVASHLMRSAATVNMILAPGDVLLGHVLLTTTTEAPLPLIELMNQMQEKKVGYLSVAFEEICQLFAEMPSAHVREITQHAPAIVQEFQAGGHLLWLREPMSTILRDVSLAITLEETDEIQLRALILKNLMNDRRKVVSKDVNLIFDFADRLIRKQYGTELFKALIIAKKYPNIPIDAKELCKVLIQAFESPFIHQRGSDALNELLKMANDAFADRFEQYRHLKGLKPSTSHIKVIMTTQNQALNSLKLQIMKQTSPYAVQPTIRAGKRKRIKESNSKESDNMQKLPSDETASDISDESKSEEENYSEHEIQIDMHPFKNKHAHKNFKKHQSKHRHSKRRHHSKAASSNEYNKHHKKKHSTKDQNNLKPHKRSKHHSEEHHKIKDVAKHKHKKHHTDKYGSKHINSLREKLSKIENDYSEEYPSNEKRFQKVERTSKQKHKGKHTKRHVSKSEEKPYAEESVNFEADYLNERPSKNERPKDEHPTRDEYSSNDESPPQVERPTNAPYKKHKLHTKRKNTKAHESQSDKKQLIKEINVSEDVERNIKERSTTVKSPQKTERTTIETTKQKHHTKWTHSTKEKNKTEEKQPTADEDISEESFVLRSQNKGLTKPTISTHKHPLKAKHKIDTNLLKELINEDETNPKDELTIEETKKPPSTQERPPIHKRKPVQKRAFEHPKQFFIDTVPFKGQHTLRTPQGHSFIIPSMLMG